MSYLVVKTRTERPKKHALKVYKDVFEVESTRKSKNNRKLKYPRQKIICKVGKLREFEKTSDKQLLSSNITDMKYDDTLREAFKTILKNYGFKQKNETLINDDVEVNLKDFTVCNLNDDKPVAIKINDGFLSTKTMQDLVKISLEDLNDAETYDKARRRWDSKVKNIGLFETHQVANKTRGLSDDSKLLVQLILERQKNKDGAVQNMKNDLQLYNALLQKHPDYNKKVKKTSLDDLPKMSLKDFKKSIGY